MVFVTKHARKRIRQRVGIPSRGIQRFVNKVYRDGIKHKDLTGSVCRFVDSLYLKEKTANEIVLYGEFVYLFGDKRLITVIHIPNKYKKMIKDMGKE